MTTRTDDSAYRLIPSPADPGSSRVTGLGGLATGGRHGAPAARGRLAELDARDISAWFGDHQVLDRVSLTMAAGRGHRADRTVGLRQVDVPAHPQPDARAGARRPRSPARCCSTATDIYDAARRLTDARRQIGMVFQKPNPFPAMSIYDNVVAGLKLTGTKAEPRDKDALVEECLTKAGLWHEVRDRLRQPGGALSGGQQQRLCIARSLAVRPRVLLMDEPCSALDPTSTRVIEETIGELVAEVTIVIVTHNMQQAARVSDSSARSSWPSRARPASSSSTAPPRRCSTAPRTRAPPTTSTAASAEPHQGVGTQKRSLPSISFS